MALVSFVSLSFAYAPGGIVAAPFGGQRVSAPVPQLQPAIGDCRSQLASIRCQAEAAAAEISPPALESAIGYDFVPLLTALQAGEFREADFITRDALITFAGEAAVKRGYVYWTEAPKLPMEDVMSCAGSNAPPSFTA